MRARMSVVPPAENGTMMVMGLLGNAACATTGPVVSRAEPSAAAAASVPRLKRRRDGLAKRDKRDMESSLKNAPRGRNMPQGAEKSNRRDPQRGATTDIEDLPSHEAIVR